MYFTGVRLFVAELLINLIIKESAMRRTFFSIRCSIHEQLDLSIACVKLE